MAKASTIHWLALGVALALGLPSAQAQQPPIKLGELNSYARWAAFTVPYRNGWQMALEEINAKGGVLGRPLEIVSRDDGSTTGDATRVADELVTREGVSLLFGSFLSNVGVAMADYANQKKIVYIAAEPLTDAITMAQGNRYTFRIRPNNFMQVGMLVDQAKASGAKRCAELRIRPVGGAGLQAPHPGTCARRRDRRRAVPGPRQDRSGLHCLGSRTGQARRHLQRALRPRPHAVRARGQHARPL
jgi:hypothetical protein